ncbi:MAG: MMPL family transporter [Desulfobacterales bacterium]|nr:MMPL family transporter [Desulfobacterales bacterium]
MQSRRLCNSYMTLMTTVIPAFLIAVGVADSVHILAIFYRGLQNGGDREDAAAKALGHSGLAIVMTSLTTARGLLSFSFAELSSIADMGLFAAAGVMLALLYTVILLSALLGLIPIKRKAGARARGRSARVDRILTGFADCILAPALMTVYTRRRGRRPMEKKPEPAFRDGLGRCVR